MSKATSSEIVGAVDLSQMTDAQKVAYYKHMATFYEKKAETLGKIIDTLMRLPRDASLWSDEIFWSVGYDRMVTDYTNFMEEARNYNTRYLNYTF